MILTMYCRVGILPLLTPAHGFTLHVTMIIVLLELILEMQLYLVSLYRSLACLRICSTWNFTVIT
ncbi:hypothetical protein Golax_003727 [Gossypium laxum]|uniref:Uncharacterized protein n=2 Tax=Gossypium TaxID=3633 RepID=A0A7J8Q8V2_GOSRA|nr:hypothetical protein [Gossypium raimondii]MBA0723118.1 hypothetical protein [Gossypium laxum]